MASDRKGRLGGTHSLLPPLRQLPHSIVRTVAVPSERAGDAAYVSETEYRKTTVTLSLADMQYLDALALDVRRIHRTHINRSEIIRALIAALRESGVDVTVAPTEAAIQAAVLAVLRE